MAFCMARLIMVSWKQEAWYNKPTMKHWSVDEKAFKKRDPEGYRLWRLAFLINYDIGIICCFTIYKIWRIQQLINYGLDGEKLDEEEVKKAWPKIKEELDPYKKRAMDYLLWEKRYSLPTNKTFWN